MQDQQDFDNKTGKYEPIEKTVERLEAELAASEEARKSAEAELAKLREREPVGRVLDCYLAGDEEKLWHTHLTSKSEVPAFTKLYAEPVPPADVAELLGKIEYLESYIEAQKSSFDEIAQGNIELQRKLAEQQAVMKLVNKAFDKTASEYRSGYLQGGSVEASDLRVEAWRAVANCGTEELTKLLAQAREEGRTDAVIDDRYKGIIAR